MSDFGPGGDRRMSWQCLHPWKSLGKNLQKVEFTNIFEIVIKELQFQKLQSGTVPLICDLNIFYSGLEGRGPREPHPAQAGFRLSENLVPDTWRCLLASTDIAHSAHTYMQLQQAYT